MIKEAIIKITNKENLTYEEAYEVLDEIMNDRASDVQKSAYLTALAMKGESIDEIAGSADAMRKNCVKLEHGKANVFEIVGTGGDKSNSFNISTTSSIVIAAGDVVVTKHGNRAFTSKCGSADVLEALGVNIMLEPAQSLKVLEKVGMCFLFAQKYHTSMKNVVHVRRELGIRTIFNILGPLSNPAFANMQLMGVFDKSLVEPLAQVLSKLGVKNAMVVHGQDGLDEISVSAKTIVCEVRNGEFKNYEINPEQFGYKLAGNNDILGGSPEDNANITKRIFDGEKSAMHDAVCLNAGAAFYIAEKTATLEEGVRMAESLIDSGKAKDKLAALVEATNDSSL